VMRPNSMDVLQRDHDAFVGRKIDTSDTSHVVCSCCRPQPAVPALRENAKRRDDARPSARAGIGVVICKTDAGY
jgi:hypothetical protein